MQLRIAANGRDVCENPGAPASMGLLELLAAIASFEAEVRVTLLVPEIPPWEVPPSIQVEAAEPHRLTKKRMRFDQWFVPRRARVLGADALICPSSCAPLVAPMPVMVVHEFRRTRPTSFASRWMEAMARAAADRAQGVLTMRDHPPFPSGRRVHAVRPWVSGAFSPTALATDAHVRERLGLESGYVLYHGEGAGEVKDLISAWSWVARAMGASCSLVVAGMPPASGQELNQIASANAMESSIRLPTDLACSDLPALYRGAAVFLHTGATATGQELRWALACGVPIAGFASPGIAGIVADAAYLVPQGDTRLLGASIITLLGEDELADSLRAKGLIRAASYHEPAALEERVALLRRMCAQVE